MKDLVLGRQRVFLLYAVLILGSVLIVHGEAQSQEQPLLYPISGKADERDTCTSVFGIRTFDDGEYDFHRGVDHRARVPKPVHACMNSNVMGVGYDAIYGGGRYLDLKCGLGQYGVIFRYLHLDSAEAPVVPLPVSAGHVIAKTGNTPSGPYHLHTSCQFREAGSPHTWVTTRTRVNALEFFPVGDGDASPEIVSVQTETGYCGSDIDYVEIAVRVSRFETDLGRVDLFLYEPTDEHKYMIGFSFNKPEVWSFDGLGLTPLPWSEIRADSLFGFFEDDPTMCTYVVAYADPYHFDQGDYTVRFTIDPDVCLPLSHFGFRAVDLNINSAVWGNTGDSPGMLVEPFTATRDGSFVVLTYGVPHDVTIYRLIVIRENMLTGIERSICDRTDLMNLPSIQQFVDSTADPTSDYRYKAVVTDRDGKDRMVAVCMYRGGALPVSFDLTQNYPNPFNLSTTIEFSVPGEEALDVSLSVFNVLGQRVRTLHSGLTLPGRYVKRWDGTSESRESVASGVYLYRLESVDFVNTKKMVLLK